jgi:16S rRNA processing protein RimM
VLEHSLGKRTSLKGLETVFIEEKKDSFLPYFVTAAQAKNEKETFLSLEGISSREATRILIKKEVWLLRKDFKKFAAGSAPISFLGFTIIHKDEELGEVIEVIEQPHQVLCTILLNNKEVLIPLHEDSLEKIDRKARKLYVNLPDGLLDL